jgi:hypothetical protein
MEPLTFCMQRTRAESNRSCMERRSEAPYFFVRGDTRTENNRSCMERRSGAPYFLYAALHV